MRQAKMVIIRNTTLGDFIPEKRNSGMPGISAAMGLLLVLVDAALWVLWIHSINGQSNSELLRVFESHSPVLLNAAIPLSLWSIGLCVSGIVLASLYWNDKGNALKFASILAICAATIMLSLTLFSMLYTIGTVAAVP